MVSPTFVLCTISTIHLTEAEFEEARPAMMMRLREEVMAKLENERWLYEPTDRFQGGL